MKKILLSLFILLSILFSFGINSVDASVFGGEDTVLPYCNEENGDKCSLDKGIELTKGINDLETEGTFSDRIQSYVGYVLTFLGIVGVLYIIYAGFIILTSAGDEEKVTSSKKTIMFVGLGLVVIFMAGPIFRWIIDILNIGN